MRADVQDDFNWQRRFIPQIKHVLADRLIVEAPFEDDAKRNTDFMVLKAEVVRVACRIRRNDITRNRDWPNQFTIRSYRPNGVQTELAKLLSGWGQFIFYGIANRDDSGLCAWLLGDLNEFRLWHHRELVKTGGQMPGVECRNGDGTKFRAYAIASMPGSFVVDRLPYRQRAA